MDGLKEIFEKISSYNIFNYLLPGILFVVLAKYFLGSDLTIENDFLGAFLYYFIGMIISRIGSLLIEPFLKWVKFLKFRDYKDFVIACAKDSKIEILSEINNTYRTLLAMVVSLLSLKLFNYLIQFYAITDELTTTVAIVMLFFLLLFSYRKQTSYISKRVDANTNNVGKPS